MIQGKLISWFVSGRSFSCFIAKGLSCYACQIDDSVPGDF